MKPKYKVGDRVVIAHRIPGKEYSINFLDSMAELGGTISAVEQVETEGRYNSYALTTVGYWWSEDMLEPFDPDPHPKYSEEEPKVLDFTPKKKHYQLNFSV